MYRDVKLNPEDPKYINTHVYTPHWDVKVNPEAPTHYLSSTITTVCHEAVIIIIRHYYSNLI